MNEVVSYMIQLKDEMLMYCIWRCWYNDDIMMLI